MLTVLLIVADIILAAAADPWTVGVGVVFWGLHMGFTQGLLATLVADVATPALRGTAFGLFNLVGGVVLLAASVIAGVLWSALGAEATFLAGAFFTTLALVGLRILPRRATTP